MSDRPTLFRANNNVNGRSKCWSEGSCILFSQSSHRHSEAIISLLENQARWQTMSNVCVLPIGPLPQPHTDAHMHETVGFVALDGVC